MTSKLVRLVLLDSVLESRSHDHLWALQLDRRPGFPSWWRRALRKPHPRGSGRARLVGSCATICPPLLAPRTLVLRALRRPSHSNGPLPSLPGAASPRRPQPARRELYSQPPGGHRRSPICRSTPSASCCWRAGWASVWVPRFQNNTFSWEARRSHFTASR